MIRMTWVLAVALLLVAACSSCKQREAQQQPAPAPRQTELVEPRDALGEPLMIALAQAKNFHHVADVYLREGKTVQAIEAVREILSLKFPAGAPEGEDAVVDARARLGTLLVTEDELDEATKVVDDGLAAAKRESFFLANLYTVRGEILAARADAIAASDPEAAKTLRRQAIEALVKSNEMHERRLEQLAKEPTP